MSLRKTVKAFAVLLGLVLAIRWERTVACGEDANLLPSTPAPRDLFRTTISRSVVCCESTMSPRASVVTRLLFIEPRLGSCKLVLGVCSLASMIIRSEKIPSFRFFHSKGFAYEGLLNCKIDTYVDSPCESTPCIVSSVACCFQRSTSVCGWD